jgi:Uma2 family endonuclease
MLMAVEHPCHVNYQTFAINQIFNATTLRLLSGEPYSPRWSVVTDFASYIESQQNY